VTLAVCQLHQPATMWERRYVVSAVPTPLLPHVERLWNKSHAQRVLMPCERRAAELQAQHGRAIEAGLLTEVTRLVSA